MLEQKSHNKRWRLLKAIRQEGRIMYELKRARLFHMGTRPGSTPQELKPNTPSLIQPPPYKQGEPFKSSEPIHIALINLLRSKGETAITTTPQVIRDKTVELLKRHAA